MLLKNVRFSQTLINLLLIVLSGWFIFYFIFYIEDFYCSMLGLLVYAVGMFLTPFIYTFGKIIFAKFGGFKIIFFRVFGSATILSDGKKRKVNKGLSRTSVDVKFGGNGPVILSACGGIIVVSLCLAGALTVFFLVPNVYVKTVMMSLCIDFAFSLINQAIPNGVNVKNDGMKLWLSVSNKECRKLFSQRLKTDYDLAMGTRYRDLSFDELEFVPDLLYLAYLVDYSYHYLDNNDMDSYFQIVDRIERLMINDIQSIVEQNCFLAISRGLFEHDIDSVRRYINNISQYITIGFDKPFEMKYLEQYLLYRDTNQALRTRELFAKVVEEIPSTPSKIIMQREINMMHPSEYHLSFEGEIVEDKKYAYAIFKGKKIYLLDLVMYPDAFVKSPQENGYVYGVFNGELSIQTSYGLLNAKEVIYAGNFFSAEDFEDKFGAKGEVLK